MTDPTGRRPRWRLWRLVLTSALWLAVAAALVACQMGVLAAIEDDPWGRGQIEGWPLDLRQARDIPRGINRYGLAINVGSSFGLAAATWFVLARWLRSARPWQFQVRSLLVMVAVVAAVLVVARAEQAWFRWRMETFRDFVWFPDSWWKNALPTPILSQGPWYIRLPLGAALGAVIYTAGLCVVRLSRWGFGRLRPMRTRSRCLSAV